MQAYLGPYWTVVAAALLLEAALYLAPGFGRLRERISGVADKTRLGVWLALSGVAPYLLYALPTGVFTLPSLAVLAGLAALAVFWQVWMPRRPLFDLLFLALMAAVAMSPIFRWAIPSVLPKVPGDLLGKLMWIRMGIAAMLFIRKVDGVGFGFIPRARDWKIGALHFAALLPVMFLLNLVFQFVKLRAWPPADPLKTALSAIAIFIGMLWVPALSEEFFFRGLLQQWLTRWLGGEKAAIVVASVAYASVHLWFPPAFPNWRMMALAFLAGVFYGHAYARAQSIRAAMVAHALVNVAWRVFFVAA